MTIQDINNKICKVTTVSGTKLSPNNFGFFTGKANGGEEIAKTWLPVGGVIYVIDSTATGIYKFKNASGVEVPVPSVGADCTGWTYIVSDANKDKFYVHQVTNRLNYDDQGGYIKWASSGEDLSPYSSQIEVLSSVNTILGKGRSNTNFIMTVKANDPVFFFERSIWQLCKEANLLVLDGCNDWYIPSIGEMSYIRNSFGSYSAFANWVQNSSQSRVICWSSSASSNADFAWSWFVDPRGSDEVGYNNRDYGNNTCCSCLSRSF